MNQISVPVEGRIDVHQVKSKYQTALEQFKIDSTINARNKEHIIRFLRDCVVLPQRFSDKWPDLIRDTCRVVFSLSHLCLFDTIPLASPEDRALLESTPSAE